MYSLYYGPPALLMKLLSPAGSPAQPPISSTHCQLSSSFLTSQRVLAQGRPSAANAKREEKRNEGRGQPLKSRSIRALLALISYYWIIDTSSPLLKPRERVYRIWNPYEGVDSCSKSNFCSESCDQTLIESEATERWNRSCSIARGVMNEAI